MLGHVKVHTYNWYKIVVFPALSKPTIITLCSVGEKKQKQKTIFTTVRFILAVYHLEN